MSHFTPQTGEAHFRSNVLVETTLKLAPTSVIESAVLDGRFTNMSASLQSLINDEETARIQGDTQLQDNINSLTSVVSSNKTLFDDFVVDSNNAMSDEIANRIAGDNAVQSNLDSHITSYDAYVVSATQALSDEAQARSDGDSAEATARANADDALDGKIVANTQLVATEKQALENQLMYGAGNDENTPDDQKDPNAIYMLGSRLQSAEGKIDAFDPVNLDDRVQQLITQHDSDNVAQNSRISKLEEYLEIDESGSYPVVRIKNGVQFEVSGNFIQGP